MNYRKIKVFDLFAGAGGFGLGFKLAGYNLELAIEIDAWAVDTLFANHHEDTLILQSDIRNYKDFKIIRGISSVIPDIIIGGPPCQGFSLAGPVKDPTDPRNSLFVDYARWVENCQPRIFVMENVTGLLQRKNSEGVPVMKIISDKFRSIGYSINIWELNAANFGVPQIRNRVFIVGNRMGENILAPIPTHYIKNSEKKKYSGLKKPVTVQNAISDLPNILAGEGTEMMDYTKNARSNYQKWSRQGSAAVYNHVAMKHSRRMIERYQAIISGMLLEELDDSLKVRKRNGNGVLSDSVYQSNYRHLKPNFPSFTVPASFYSNFIHPKYPRNLTSREAARLQSFPDWYVFKGKRTQISSKLLAQSGKTGEDHLSQYNQIGNAVPPLLSKAIAEHLKNYF